MNNYEKIKYKRWLTEQKRKSKPHHAYKNKTFKNKTGQLSEILLMPVTLDIYDNQSMEETFRIIQRLEKHQHSQTNVIILNFKETKEVKAAALLMLFSVVDKLIVECNKKIKIINNQVNERVNNTLNRSGMIYLCRKGSLYCSFTDKYLPIISSTGGKYRDEIIDFIAKKIYKDMPPALENIYADAIQEAINNVAAHAYLNFDTKVQKNGGYGVK